MGGEFGKGSGWRGASGRRSLGDRVSRPRGDFYIEFVVYKYFENVNSRSLVRSTVPYRYSFFTGPDWSLWCTCLSESRRGGTRPIRSRTSVETSGVRLPMWDLRERRPCSATSRGRSGPFVKSCPSPRCPSRRLPCESGEEWSVVSVVLHHHRCFGVEYTPYGQSVCVCETSMLPRGDTLPWDLP